MSACATWLQFPTEVYNTTCAPITPFKLNDTGTASLAGTFGTTTFNWYTPVKPGANPEYWSVAKVDPK
jgi:hypothetical protein